MAIFNFERTSKREGFLRRLTVTYTIADAQGRLFGTLIINGLNARCEGPLSGETFDLQKSFWGRSWKFVGDTERTFVSFSQGWKSNVILPDGSTYQIKIFRKWWLFNTKDIPGNLQAVISDRDEVVFTLDNLAERNWATSQAFSFMQGNITTDIVDFPRIAALLLAIQFRIEMETRAAT